MLHTTTSTDGTKIAFDVIGDGPSLVVLGGAFNTRHSPHPLVDLLAERFTVYNPDRRGRGDSGNTLPYATRREVEDVEAVIRAAGGASALYGHSSGAILALETAAAVAAGAASAADADGVTVTALAVYEPPYDVHADRAATPDTSVQEALDAGDNDGAARAFLRITGMNDGAIEGMSGAPFWQGMISIAHTLAYDLALTGDGRVPVELLSALSIPTLLLSGGASEAWAGAAIDLLAGTIPGSEKRTVAGQNHQVDQAVLAPILAEFFGRAA